MGYMRFIKVPSEEEIQARTVIAENLPLYYSLKNLEKLFWKYGSVKRFRVTNPQNPEIAGCSRDVLTIREGWCNFERTLSGLHAIVEYETAAQANKAIGAFYPDPRCKNGFFIRSRRNYSIASENGRRTRSDINFNMRDGMRLMQRASPQKKQHHQGSQRHNAFLYGKTYNDFDIDI